MNYKIWQENKFSGYFGQISTGYGRKILDFIKPLLVVLLFWEIVVRLGLISPSALPPLSSVASSLFILTISGEMMSPLFQTAYRVLLAFGIAGSIGVLIGVMMGQYRIVEWFFEPLTTFGFPVPKITFVPLFTLWFGFGSRSIILLAAFAAIFPVIIATHSGSQGIKKELVWSAKSMNISNFGIAWRVRFPVALPTIFNGLQIGLFLSIIITLIAEMVISEGGIGGELVMSMRFYQTSNAIAYLLAAISIGIIGDRLFRILRLQILSWTK